MMTIGNEFHQIFALAKDRLELLGCMAGVSAQLLKENLADFLKETKRIDEGIIKEQGYTSQGWVLKSGARDAKSILSKLYVNDKGLLFLADLIKRHIEVFLKKEKYS